VSNSVHLDSQDQRAIDLFLHRLMTIYGQDVIDVRLFGSKARGDAGADSDLDVLVLVKRSDYALKHAILWLAADVSLACDVLLAPCVIPWTAWERMADANTLFYRDIRSEGVSLLPELTV
jgi:predicted nucleotidyltransferase